MVYNRSYIAIYSSEYFKVCMQRKTLKFFFFFKCSYCLSHIVLHICSVKRGRLHFQFCIWLILSKVAYREIINKYISKNNKTWEYDSKQTEHFRSVSMAYLSGKDVHLVSQLLLRHYKTHSTAISSSDKM